MKEETLQKLEKLIEDSQKRIFDVTSKIIDLISSRAISEMAMLSWESRLPDSPLVHRVLIVNGQLTEISRDRLAEFIQQSVLGGVKKHQSLVFEFEPGIEDGVKGGRFTFEDIFETSTSSRGLETEYLRSFK